MRMLLNSLKLSDPETKTSLEGAFHSAFLQNKVCFYQLLSIKLLSITIKLLSITVSVTINYYQSRHELVRSHPVTKTSLEGPFHSAFLQNKVTINQVTINLLSIKFLSIYYQSSYYQSNINQVTINLLSIKLISKLLLSIKTRFGIVRPGDEDFARGGLPLGFPPKQGLSLLLSMSFQVH